jgi:demethylmenaquinone methyltransferase / 2-methoxy-6-polyprenyl-1,4-benzoquinol methylase
MPLPAAEPNRFAQRLFTPLPARYDRLAEILSFGQNGRWRHEMVRRVVAGIGPRPAAGLILDVASGTAGVALAWT